MSRYATETTVPVAKSRAEIEATRSRYGVVERAWADVVGKSSIQFRFADLMVRFVLELPDPSDDSFKYTKHKNRYQATTRSPEARRVAWEQACRQRWRALALAIKAKLEAVESNIATFEQEFASYIIMPGTNGCTVGDLVIPKIREAYRTGTMPRLSLLDRDDSAP